MSRIRTFPSALHRRVAAGLVTITLGASSGGVAHAQALPPGPDAAIPCSRSHSVQSRITGRTYPVDVGLPPSYCANPADTTHFPTLYLLDNLMRVATPWFRYRSLGGSIREPGLIIVGIGWPAPPPGNANPQYWRMIEFFPPVRSSSNPRAVPTADSLAYAMAREMTREVSADNMSGRPGEAPLFLRVIREEIIPFIERTYRVTDDRGLFGHSAGGFFAMYALLESPETFSRYAASSPVFFWDDYWIYARESMFAQNRDSLRKKVYLVSGADESMNREDVFRMARVLKLRQYKGLELTAELVPGRHFSGEGLFKAINTLYPIVR